MRGRKTLRIPPLAGGRNKGRGTRTLVTGLVYPLEDPQLTPQTGASWTTFSPLECIQPHPTQSVTSSLLDPRVHES